MTAHPIDTEALRVRAAHVYRHGGPANAIESLAANIPGILDRLADAEHRATRAEAERDEWRQTALDERGAALDALEQIKARDARVAKEKHLRMKATAAATEAEARIKAVRELHQQSALVRHVPRFMREGHDDDQPFHYCTGCDGARYPCDTIRALEG